MSWVQHLLYLVIASFGFALILLLRLKFSSRLSVWAKLDAVGASPQDCPPSFVRDVALSIVLTRKFAHEGYRKFSKALDRPYALPTPWVRGSSVMVLPPSKIPLLTRPDNTKDGEWTNLHGLIETTQLAYIIDDPNVYQNVLHFDVVRRKMALRDMSRLAPVMADEIDHGFSEIWGTETEWNTVNGWEASDRIIARATQRFLIALPLSRDTTMLETSRLCECSPGRWRYNELLPAINTVASGSTGRYPRSTFPSTICKDAAACGGGAYTPMGSR